MKKALFLLAFGFLSLLSAHGWGEEAAAGAQLTARAAERLAEAKQELATLQQTQLAERKELAARLQTAYQELATASSRTKAAETELAELTRNRNEFRRNEEAYRYKYRSLRDELTSAGGKSFDKDHVSKELPAEIWQCIEARLALFDRGREISWQEEEAINRAGLRQRLPVLRLGHAAAYGCGDHLLTCGVTESASHRPLRVTGLPLEERGHAALAQILAGNPVMLPADVSGTLNTRELEQQPSLWAWFQAGGFFMYPIVLVGLAGCLLILERLRYLRRMVPSSTVQNTICQIITTGRCPEDHLPAIRTYAEGRLAWVGMQCMREELGERELRMETALVQEEPELRRSLGMLATLAGVAPLLGLLGTVSGMIQTFTDIAAFGTGNSRILSGGISEALITTELGLIVAVPLLLAHAWLSSMIERRSVKLEQLAMNALHIPAPAEARTS